MLVGMSCCGSRDSWAGEGRDYVFGMLGLSGLS